MKVSTTQEALTTTTWEFLLSERELNRPVSPFQLRNAVAAGIPAAIRPRAWLTFSGAGEIMAKHIGLYQKLVEGQTLTCSSRTSTRDLAQIETDLRRSDSDETHLLSLRRILQALCSYLPTAAYVQGQNFVTTGLLRVLAEEEAFW